MAIYAVKKKGETNERLMSRFKKQVQGSRIIQLLREKRYNRRKAKKRLIRQAAVMREYHRARKREEQFQ